MTLKEAHIVCLPGDGIGPEIVEAAYEVLEAAASRAGLKLTRETHLIGGAAIDAEGDPLPPKTEAACRAAQGILLGAVGGPKWDDPKATMRPEQGLLRIRKALGLFANLRPVVPHPAIAEAWAPLRPERLQGVDIMMVRELTGGIYFGEPRFREQDRALDSMVYTEAEVERVARLAFQLAQGRKKHVTSVDKANVLACSRLWRDVVSQVAKDYPDVELTHQLVDSCAMKLITEPAIFDVILTSNMFGDILSDEAAVIGGSLGVLPSASMGQEGVSLYEPIHGSAPDIAGKGIANPIGTILSAALLMRHALKAETAAAQIEAAVAKVLGGEVRTPDLGGQATSRDVTDAVLAAL